MHGTTEKFSIEDILSGKYGINRLKEPSTDHCLTFKLTEVSEVNIRAAVGAWNRRIYKGKGMKLTARKDGPLRLRVYLLRQSTR